MTKHIPHRVTRKQGQSFTAGEFKALPRYGDGNIIDLHGAHPFITAEQRELLTASDQSRAARFDEGDDSYHPAHMQSWPCQR